MFEQLLIFLSGIEDTGCLFSFEFSDKTFLLFNDSLFSLDFKYI